MNPEVPNINPDLKEIIKQEENRTLAFKPTDAIVFESFAVEAHYNLVIMCKPPLSKLLSDSIAPLTGNLIPTGPENYHVTICTFPANIERPVIADVKSICKHSPITLQVEGLHLQPKGVVANAYSLDGTLASLRAQIAKKVGSDFYSSSRWPDAGWVTLGRYTHKLSLRTCQYIQDRVNQEFGSFTNTAVLFKSDSRQRLGEAMW